eukprot:249163_1
MDSKINVEKFWKDFIVIYCRKYVRRMMEKALTDIIFEFFLIKWEIWDENRLDSRLKIMAKSENKTITKTARQGGWDFNSGFAKGEASNTIDISFKLEQYQNYLSTIGFGICPIEHYKKNRRKHDGLESCIGHSGWPNSFSYDAHQGNIMIKGQTKKGKNKSKTGDVIRIILQNSKVEFYVNGIKQYESIEVDENTVYIPGVSMYVTGDQISIVESKQE